MEEPVGGTLCVPLWLEMQYEANPPAAVSLLRGRASTARADSVEIFFLWFQLEACECPQPQGPLLRGELGELMK